MQYTIAIAIALTAFTLCHAAPAPTPPMNQGFAFVSDKDITGQQLRQKRASQEYYQGDYFICYPSSAVYGNNNSGGQHRRSGEFPQVRRSGVISTLEERIARADRERAAYTDSYGK
ncbi:uncharacterized protein LOC115634316 [Scaptodrosophila lebanonensis]|uniref:Uncharacterized protein LOC115634316 n=1 Tax=Drosophila lebanonensis TaxID=7225 RepID=A0A6J2UHB7_DROLE|nr:uncharacterized protein LOC115634316 [Scaptodrosophila lebanonensis]